MDPNLTERQREVLDFILSFHKKHDFFPSLREIAEAHGCSVGTVQTHLEYLSQKGALIKPKGKARAFIVSPFYKKDSVDEA